MPTASVADKVQPVLQRDEATILNALEIYYSRSGTQFGVTFQGAAALAGANPAFVVDYMALHRLGMPENRTEAEAYMREIRRMKESRYALE